MRLFVDREGYYAINTAGVIAGTEEVDPQRGQMALDVGGGPVPFPHNKNEGVVVRLSQTSLNNLDQVVGYWYNDPTSYSGFFYDSNSKKLNTTFNMPGAVSSFPIAINDNQEVVGSWTDQNDIYHGFYWNSTTGFSNIDVTGDTEMQIIGINNRSVILGAWQDANTPPKYHYVTIVNGQPTASINAPQSKYTLGFAINNTGQVVGEYETQTGVWRGFIYTPSK
jgi:probable HAF family extracellular repeat protein